MSDKETERDRRQDDSLMRKIYVSLIAALVLMVITETAGLIYVIGVVRTETQDNSRDIVALKKQVTELKDINNNLIRLEVQMQTVANVLSSLVLSVKDVAYEQQRRTPIVNRADRFMDEHIKEHNKAMK